MTRSPAGEVFLVALRLGLTSFGGPIAHIGYFRREYVERRRWLDEATFADLIALSQVLPGPSSSQIGIAIGARRAGFLGGLLAWLGFTLPSAILMILFGLVASSMDLADAGWIHGLKLAAVAVVALAIWSMARALATDWPRRAIALAAAGVALAWTGAFSQIAIIAGAALIGRLILAAPPEPADRTAGATWSRSVGARWLAIFAGLLLGLPVLHALVGPPAALVDVFFRAGSLVFGGGHVVLPLLHASVVEPGWVGESAFLAGYGAAQAVPGPLLSFAGYLGTVSTLPPGGALAGVLAIGAIFLPSFLLVFGVLPFWDQLRAAGGVRSALSGINAAVVGILLAAWVTPILTSAIASPVDAVIAATATAALATKRVPPIVVVAVCAVVAQLTGA